MDARPIGRSWQHPPYPHPPAPSPLGITTTVASAVILFFFKKDWTDLSRFAAVLTFYDFVNRRSIICSLGCHKAVFVPTSQRLSFGSHRLGFTTSCVAPLNPILTLLISLIEAFSICWFFLSFFSNHSFPRTCPLPTTRVYFICILFFPSHW